MIGSMIVLAASLTAVVVGIRGATAEKEFEDRCKKRMLEENEEIVEAWRESGATGKSLTIERTIKSRGILPGRVRVKRTYTR